MKYYITGLDALDALSLSRRLWDLFLPAVNRAPAETRYTYEGFLHEIARKETQIWVAINLVNDEIVGGFTTCVSDDKRFPGVVLLEIPLVAGKDIKGWLGPGLRILNDWGLEQGCDIMVAYGRKGWERLAGFEYHSDMEDGVRVMIRPIMKYH